MGTEKKPGYDELEAYVKKFENKVYRALRTEAINRTLFDIANAQNASHTLQELYRSIHGILSNLMDMTNFYIAIYYKNRNAIQLVYHVDKHDSHKVKWIENFTRHRSLTGDVIMARQPLLIKEDRLKELAAQGRIKGTVPRIWLGVPLMIKNEVMGVMAVQSYTDPDRFTDSDVDVLTFVSEQIALSIEKKRAQEHLLRAREKLIRTEKLEAIGTLAGGIAHDFNNTLSVTLGNINLAQLMVTEPELVQILTDAETSVLQAKELASRFIVFAKGGVLTMAAVNSRRFIAGMMASISEETAIPFRLEIGPIPGSIEINADQLKEAVKNIVINAHEAMDRKGEVDISCKPHPVKPDHMVISIIDTGRGIEKKCIEKVFEPYYSTKSLGKEKGTGLGMSIAYSIVKSHNGDILIGSSPGSGTRVDIILPVVQPGASGSEKPACPGQDSPDAQGRSVSMEPSVRKKKVLVMDDDDIVLKTSSKVLQRLGYEAVTAKNGEQAILAFKRSVEAGGPIQMAVLDLEVKQGMGGIETMQKLLAMDPGIKGIIASGYSSDRIMENPQDYGFALAIAKPFQMETLQTALESLVQQATS